MDFLGIELFLDDEMISYTRNMRRELHQARKYEHNPIITNEYPWEGTHVTLYGSVLADESRGVLRMWYNAYGEKYYEQQTLAYAESEDGIHWDKPMMDYVSWEGYKKTNILMGPDPNLHGPCVILNPDQTDPSRRFLLLFDSYARYHPEVSDNPAAWRACYAAESPDGFRWSPSQGRLAFAGKADSGQCVVWEPLAGKFRAYARNHSKDINGSCNRIFRLVESTDFIHWETPTELFRPDELDGEPDRQLQQIAVTRFDGLYVGLLGLFRRSQCFRDSPTHIHEGDQLDEIQLITSRDGVRFTRVADRAVFLPKSQPPQWGTGGQRMASQMVLHKDKVLVYYGSRGQDASGVLDKPLQIGLATIPRDQFVSMVPNQLLETGMLELRPLVYRGGSLYLNTTVLAGGSVCAELTDFEGTPIEGFDRDNAIAIEEDGLDQPVRWKAGDRSVSLNELGSGHRFQPLRLRLWIHHAHVHALRER